MRPIEWYEGAIAALASCFEIEGVTENAQREIESRLRELVRNRTDAMDELIERSAERDRIVFSLVEQFGSYAIDSLAKMESRPPCSDGS